MLAWLKNAWAAIPRPVRTVVNVAIAGAVVVVAGAVMTAHGVTGVNWSTTGRAALDALGLGVATAVLRALNPLDDAYGVASATDTGDLY